MASVNQELQNYFDEVKHEISGDVFNGLMMCVITFLTQAKRDGIDSVQLLGVEDEELLSAFEEYKDSLKKEVGQQ